MWGNESPVVCCELHNAMYLNLNPWWCRPPYRYLAWSTGGNKLRKFWFGATHATRWALVIDLLSIHNIVLVVWSAVIPSPSFRAVSRPASRPSSGRILTTTRRTSGGWLHWTFAYKASENGSNYIVFDNFLKKKLGKRVVISGDFIIMMDIVYGIKLNGLKESVYKKEVK